MTEDAIASDAPLTAQQRRNLDILLDMIVPASADGRKPSAAEVDVLGYICARESETLAGLREDLHRLDAEAEALHGQAFAVLAPQQRQAVVADLRRQGPHFLRNLALQTVTCYYEDDRFCGRSASTPGRLSPQGYEVPAGDLSLLDPVRRRGRIYRDAG